MSRPTRVLMYLFSHTGLSPAPATLSKVLLLTNTPGTGLVRFRSPLLTESRLMSFPPGTEMFQFPGFASLSLFYSAQ